MIQSSMSHPLARLNDLSFFGGCDDGMNFLGRFTALDCALEDDTVFITWDYELKLGVGHTRVGVYVFSNGTLIDIVGIGEKAYALKMGLLQKRTVLDLYILPRSDFYRYIGYPLFGIIKDRVYLEWEQNSRASQVQVVYGLSEVPDTVLHTFTAPVARVLNPTVASGTILHVAGTWRDPSVLYTNFTISVTNDGLISDDSHGVIDNLVDACFGCSWDNGGTIFTYYGKMSTVGQELFNGLIVWWERGDSAAAIGEEWTVQIGLQNNYTTRSLDDGNYSFKTTSIGITGNATDSAILYPVRINVPPDPPTIDSIERVDGVEEITFHIAIPDDDTISHIKLYRNRVFSETLIPHWLPRVFLEATANTVLEMGAYKDLVEGTNIFVFRTVDRDGIESEDLLYELILDADLKAILGPPSPPESIKARVLSSGDIEVTVVVNRDATLVSIYSSAGSTDRGEAVSYTTPVTTISGIDDEEDCQSFTATVAVDTDGYYTFGARCSNTSVEETNTDITVEVYREIAYPSANTNLSATVIV